MLPNTKYSFWKVVKDNKKFEPKRRNFAKPGRTDRDIPRRSHRRRQDAHTESHFKQNRQKWKKIENLKQRILF